MLLDLIHKFTQYIRTLNFNKEYIYKDKYPLKYEDRANAGIIIRKIKNIVNLKYLKIHYADNGKLNMGG